MLFKANWTLLARDRPFLYYCSARTLSELSNQIATVVIGWQVYALTGSPLNLGLVGLVQFVPTAALTFVAGHVADRYDRRRIVQMCQFLTGATAVFLAWRTQTSRLNIAEMFAAVALFGVATAFESPAAAALLPSLVPEERLPQSTAISTGGFQLAAISGPALGGLIYAMMPAAPYLAMAVFWIIAAMLNGAIRAQQRAPINEPATFGTLFAGVRFIRRNPVIMGIISLDLFIVLLGGATALLPIYARDILHTGPWGLGILRSAPAAGALLVTAVLAHRAIHRRLGLRMFQAVIVFGLATVVFAISRTLWLSVFALAVLGAADTVSMVIRVALVQLATPDIMRGRVGAVNYMFVNASYQVGEFESGVTAALFGAVPAVVLGGFGTLVVALLWMKLFPSLRKMESFDETHGITR